MNKCKVCRLPIPENRKVCSISCRGKYANKFVTKGRRKPLQEKVEREHPQGYYYYTHSMCTDDELALLPGSGNIILAHRLIYAKYHNTIVYPDEIVMHLNGNKKDNRIGNLYLGTQSENRMQHIDAVKDSLQNKYLAAWVLLAFMKG